MWQYKNENKRYCGLVYKDGMIAFCMRVIAGFTTQETRNHNSRVWETTRHCTVNIYIQYEWQYHEDG